MLVSQPQICRLYKSMQRIKEDVLKKIISFLVILIITIFLFEFSVRVAQKFNIGDFNSPHQYAFHLCDDLFWILQRYLNNQPIVLFQKRTVYQSTKATDHFINYTRDLQLGYTVMKDPTKNPLGIIKSDQKKLLENTRKIIFLGDSMIAGETIIENTITEKMEQKLDNVQVLNYAVPGYGLGQIYIRFKNIYQKFPESLFLFGIFDDDINRIFLSFRGTPKPTFTLTDHGEIKIIPIRSIDYYKKQIPLFFCYHFIRHQYHRFIRSHTDRCNNNTQKKQMVYAILKNIQSLLGKKINRMGIVVFSYGLENERELINQAAIELNIPVIDISHELTKNPVYRYDDLFSNTNHPNQLGNEEISKLIVNFIDSNFDIK